MSGVMQTSGRLATAAALISLLAIGAMTAGAASVASSGSIGTPFDALPVAAAPTLPAPITAPPGAVRTMSFSYSFYPAAVADQAVYYLPSPDRLFMADLSSRTSHRVKLSLIPGERIERVATDGRTLVLLLWRRINPLPPTGDIPCNGDEDRPIAWRLLAAPLAHGRVTGPFRLLDAGRNVLVFEPAFRGEGCAATLVPQIAVASGRVAYSAEHMTSAQPAGSRILVRSLVSGAVVRSVTRPWQAIALALSSTTIAWSESDNAHASSSPDRWAVRRASIAGGASTKVDLGTRMDWFADAIALSGDAVVLNIPQSNGVLGTVIRIAPTGSVSKLNPPGAGRCEVEGTSGTTIAMTCEPQAAVPAFMLWRSAHGAHPLLDLTGGVVGPTSVAWLTSSATSGSSLSVVRLADLRWP